MFSEKLFEVGFDLAAAGIVTIVRWSNLKEGFVEKNKDKVRWSPKTGQVVKVENCS